MPKGKQGTGLLWIGGCLAAAVPAHAATPACATISNVARIDYAIGADPRALESNAAALQVGELLDVRLSAPASARSIARDTLAASAFALVNAGNGEEAFLLGGRVDGVAAAVEAFAIDRDGDGRFDDAVDIRLVPGAPTPAIPAGAGVTLLALVRGTATGSGTLTVTARAATGSGAPGTGFAGAGAPGCDATVGATGAAGEAGLTLTVAEGGDPSQIALTKSQRIAAPDGGADPLPGALVTYSIESRFGGSGVVRDVRITDPVPTGTSYAPGSLRLDGTALTDAADGDPGRFDGTSILVALGDLAGPTTHVITFQVKIQ